VTRLCSATILPPSPAQTGKDGKEGKLENKDGKPTTGWVKLSGRPHNPKVAGSNPVPATTFEGRLSTNEGRPSGCLPDGRFAPNYASMRLECGSADGARMVPKTRLRADLSRPVDGSRRGFALRADLGLDRAISLVLAA